MGNEPGHTSRLFTVDLAGGKPRAITPEGVLILNQGPLSPDGKSIVAVGPNGRAAIYPTEPGEPRPIPGLTPDDSAIRWTADGRSVYFFNIVARPGVVDIVDVQTGKRIPWKEFHPPDPAGVIQIAPFLATADGATYSTPTAAYSTTSTSSPASSRRNVLGSGPGLAAAVWEVDDVEGIVRELKSRGVKFEHYDNMPGLTRDGDIHRAGDFRVALWKDPSGNILSVQSRSAGSRSH